MSDQNPGQNPPADEDGPTQPGGGGGGNGNGNGNGNNGNGNGNGTGNGENTPDDENDNNDDTTTSTPVISIPDSAPAGALSMINPPMASTTFYKIAPLEYITFQWSLTDIGPNEGTLAGDTTELVWNSYEWNQANPTLRLTPEKYRLSVWDNRGDGVPRLAGHMQAFHGLEFALYTPLPYTALAGGWKCTDYNAGTRLSSHPLSIALISTVLIVFLSSFTLLRGVRRG
ncbi:hypothetical protein BDV98DRAFT_583508 [Pterulicium gracile]|uniref:DUF7137 domain-containing protein n=1 Tax=Pterulicium gracile TaxID=1884261 RepID=A0A5C3QDS3_9AGAR|nr:hypothetical protein BDV98DRAFT_583508 [Pterula gracilis]